MLEVNEMLGVSWILRWQSVSTIANAIIGAVWFSRIWYSLPLIAAISLVYAATRHEALKPILDHALRFAFWVITFMVLVYLLLTFASYWL